MLGLKFAVEFLCAQKKNEWCILSFFFCMFTCVWVCETHLSQSFAFLQELVQQPADIRAAKESIEIINDPSYDRGQKLKVSVHVWL